MKKLKNLESKLLHYTENQILRKLKNPLRQPLQIAYFRVARGAREWYRDSKRKRGSVRNLKNKQI